MTHQIVPIRFHQRWAEMLAAATIKLEGAVLHCHVPSTLPKGRLLHVLHFLFMNFKSWLKKKQTTVTSASPATVKGKEKATAKLRHLLPRKGPRSKREETTHSDGASLRLRKVVPGTSFQPSKNSKNTKTKKEHNRTEGTPSFRRRHKMFKHTTYSSDQALYSKETKLGLTNSLSFTITLAATLSKPHIFLVHIVGHNIAWRLCRCLFHVRWENRSTRNTSLGIRPTLLAPIQHREGTFCAHTP